MDDVSQEEISGVMFAQHYADSRGNPSREAWDRVVELYGLVQARGILASVRMIMLGNATGIPWSSFIGRFKRKPDSRCTLLYEISMILATILFMPIAFVHMVFAKLLRMPSLEF